MEASVDDILHALYEVNEGSGDVIWDPTMLSSRTIESFDQSHQICTCIRQLMPMTDTRQFIYFACHRAFDDGTIVCVETSFKTRGDAELHKFDDEESVLASINLSGFVLSEPTAEQAARVLENAKAAERCIHGVCTHVTAFSQIEPNGMIPSFVRDK